MITRNPDNLPHQESMRASRRVRRMRTQEKPHKYLKPPTPRLSEVRP